MHHSVVVGDHSSSASSSCRAFCVFVWVCALLIAVRGMDLSKVPTFGRGQANGRIGVGGGRCEALPEAVSFVPPEY